MNSLNKPKLIKYFSMSIFVLCFLLLYFEIILEMVNDWKTNDNYSHGFLIPFITAYLIWIKKDKFSEASIKPESYGLLYLMLSLVFFIVTNIGAELFTMRFSMILVLISGVYCLFGANVMRMTIVPLLYLTFMIPFPAIIWNMIAFPLKLFATSIAVNFIKIINIPVYNEGNIIHLSNTTLEVVDACSGLRSLVSLLALSAAFALINFELNIIKKTLLFISAVPIAILLNIFRLTVTAVLAREYGPQIAQGFLHDVSGMVVFAIALVMLFSISKILIKSGQTE